MIKAILTDIEGTITRISFVKDVLFPYAAGQLPEFVKSHQSDPEVAAQIEAVKAHIEQPEADIDTVISHLIHWIDLIHLIFIHGLGWPCTTTGYWRSEIESRMEFYLIPLDLI